MQADIVTGVYQESALGPYSLGKGDGIIHQLMGVMGLVETEGIHHQHFHISQIVHLALIDGFHIRDISQVTNTIGQNRQFAVHHHKRGHRQVTEGQRLVGLNLMQSDGRHTRITMLRKAIGQHLQHPLTGDGIGIDIDFTKLTIGTDIIHTAHVVVVSMRYQNSINLPERLWQDLLTEIRTAVYQQTGLVSLYEDRTTATLVMWVITLTDLTLATDHWYATGCSRSQKRQLQIMFTSG